MKQLLGELRKEFKEDLINDYSIQFKINDSFYELNKGNKGEWTLLTVFGIDLKLDTKKLKGLSKEKVKQLLKDRFKNIKIY